MERLTIWNEQTEMAELIDWDTEEWKEFMSDFDVPVQISLGVAIDKLAHYEDLEEQGLLHKAEIKDGTPIWYIASLDDEGPFLIKSSYIYNVTEYEVGDLEKDFWLSEEEAEKVLAEMEEK